MSKTKKRSHTESLMGLAIAMADELSTPATMTPKTVADFEANAEAHGFALRLAQEIMFSICIFEPRRNEATMSLAIRLAEEILDACTEDPEDEESFGAVALAAGFIKAAYPHIVVHRSRGS